MNLKKLSYEFKRHLSDSTASIILYTPTMAALETLVARMSDLVSINSRMLAAAITYSGEGIISKVRDYSKEFFGIKKESKEITKNFHDIVFSVTCTSIIKPLIYLVSGETDWEKIAIGTLSSMGIGTLFGGPFGYLTDVYRDLTGIKESERTPKILRRRTGRTKKAIAAGLLAVSIGLTGLVYTLTPQKEIANLRQRSHLEQVVETTINQYETISTENYFARE